MRFISEILNINRFKILLFLVLIIPLIFILTLILGPEIPYYYILNFYNYPFEILGHLSWYIIMGVVLSYLISVIIDFYVTSANTKIFIALILGLSSIIILYLVYKFMTDPLICDPVHHPGNQTVCDPVHRSQENGMNSLVQLKEIKVDVKEVSQSLEECLKRL